MHGAVGVVGLLVGGILYWILRPGDDPAGLPVVVSTPVASSTSPPALPSAPPVLPPDILDRRPPTDGPEGECAPGEACLRIAADGPGSVSYFLADRVTERSCPPTGEACFPDGVSVSLYRTRALSPEVESGARLTEWKGDCAHLVADEQPRGGVCDLTMDGDREVGVSFEIRPRLHVQMPGPAIGWFDLSYQPEQVFAPAPSGHRLGCGRPPCTVDYFYDLGTEVTIHAGYQHRGLAQTAATLEWAGACAGTPGWDRQDPGGTDPDVPCAVVMNGDSDAILEFGPFEDG